MPVDYTSFVLVDTAFKGVYDGAIYTYQHSFLRWLRLEGMGVFTAVGNENKPSELLEWQPAAGAALLDSTLWELGGDRLLHPR